MLIHSGPKLASHTEPSTPQARAHRAERAQWLQARGPHAAKLRVGRIALASAGQAVAGQGGRRADNAQAAAHSGRARARALAKSKRAAATKASRNKSAS